MNDKFDINLSQRHNIVLQLLVEEHIRTARTVSSQNISQKMHGAISSATVRNIFNDLERYGLVMQPHISAGRVPTAEGFKYYVMQLMKPRTLTLAEKNTIEQIFEPELGDILGFIEGLSNILAAISKELAVIIAPSEKRQILHRLEIVPIAESKVVIVLITSSGLTKSVIIDSDTPLTTNQINLIEEILNSHLAGLNFSEIRTTIAERLKDIDALRNSLLQKIIRYAKDIFRIKEEYIATSGRNNILSKPEFSDPQKMKKILEIIENLDLLLQQLIPENNTISVEVIVSPPQMNDIGIVATSYFINERLGIIAVIGPKRMNYSKIVNLISFTSQKMQRLCGKENWQ